MRDEGPAPVQAAYRELPTREIDGDGVDGSSRSRPAWRIVEPEEVETAFEGEGVARTGGRWNSKGVRVVYLSSSLALAALELLAQLDGDAASGSFVAIPVDLGSVPMLEVRRGDLPTGWDAADGVLHTRVVGDAWVRRAESAVLVVPSRLIEVERNYLLNPAHPDADGIAIGEPRPFRFDADLLEP